MKAIRQNRRPSSTVQQTQRNLITGATYSTNNPGLRRIMFLCGSLSSGRDGVGDYTRSLANACVTEGCEVALIALHDRWIAEVKEYTDDGMRVIRLAARSSWREKQKIMRCILATLQPDWMSLQFVPYAFQDRGIPWQLPRWFADLEFNGNWHVMFHELWIGESTDYGLTERAIGFMQKCGVLRLLRTLRPKSVHTSNPIYRALLAANGVSSEVLPLFGSVPFIVTTGARWLYEVLATHGIVFDGQESRRPLLMGMFGTIHPQWRPDPFIAQTLRISRQMQRQLVLLVIGRIGKGGERTLQEIENLYRKDFLCLNLGEQSLDRISEFLQTIDFGVTTSPWALTGKSSTVAAMLDHGVPVVVPRDDWMLRAHSTPAPVPDSLLFRTDDTLLLRLIGRTPRGGATPRLRSSAGQFLEALRLVEDGEECIPKIDCAR